MPKVVDTDDYGQVNRSVAREVAMIFLRHPAIKRVELFGSVARYGFGDDLDLILVTEDEYASRFISNVHEQVDEFGDHMYNERAADRYDATSRVFDHTFIEYLAAVEWLVSGKLDIFVFPEDWRNKLDLLQECFEHDDPLFMHNIAKDAVVIAP